MPKKSNKVRPDGRIAVQVYLGKKDGKRQYKTVYGKTQKEADRAADEIREKHKKGYKISANDTFSQWCERWLDAKRNESSDDQCNLYAARLSVFCEELGERKISELLPYHFQSVIDMLAHKNPHTGKPSAKKTLREYGNAAAQVCEYAIINRAIDYNAARQIKYPHNAPQSERRALTAQERHRIDEFEHRARLPALIMMYAGLRLGELTALEWADVDVDAGTITVNKSYNFKQKKTKSPKSKAGIRIVPMPQPLIDEMRKSKKSSGLVIVSAHGNMMTHTAWVRLWKSYLCDMDAEYGSGRNKHNPHGIAMDIQPFTPHCLRHTYCTMLYEAGVDVVVAKNLMGHSDIKTTLAIYTHLQNEHKQNSIDKLNDYIKYKSNCKS